MSTQNVKAAIIDENGGSEKFKIITQEVGSPEVMKYLLNTRL